VAEEEGKAVRFGPYVLTGRLGEGGMCHVFRAYREETGEEVALKLLKEDQRQDEKVVDLFVTEADLSLMLRHPNLIRTLDAGAHNERHYIAMEIIEGANLREIEVQCQRIGVPMPPDFALYFVREMLEGLGALHDAAARSGRPLGLVHRDVTPSNVFVAWDGRVVVGDFGIAHIMAYGDADPGQAVGKVGYLSPEVVLGVGLDRRSDLFAVGIILWELLTGERLFKRDRDDDAMLAIADAIVPRPRKLKPGMHRGLEEVVLKSLARKRAERYQDAQEMIAALDPFWSQEIGHPIAIQSFLAGLFRDEVARFRTRRTNPPPRAKPKSGNYEPITLGPLPDDP